MTPPSLSKYQPAPGALQARPALQSPRQGPRRLLRHHGRHHHAVNQKSSPANAAGLHHPRAGHSHCARPQGPAAGGLPRQPSARHCDGEARAGPRATAGALPPPSLPPLCRRPLNLCHCLLPVPIGHLRRACAQGRQCCAGGLFGAGEQRRVTGERAASAGRRRYASYRRSWLAPTCPTSLHISPCRTSTPRCLSPCTL